MAAKLTADDLERVSVDQLSRTIFRHIKHMRGNENYRRVFSIMIDGPVGRDGESKFDTAWFRLVDRGLIRWAEGPDVRQHYMLTEKGETSRYGEGTVEDPDPAIGALESTIGTALDPVIKLYLSEAISTFHGGHLLASQFCIGAVSERVAFLIRDWLADKTPEGTKLASKTKVGEVIDGLTAGLEGLRKPRPDWPAVADLLDCIEHFAHAYRRSRNDVGHPTEVRHVNEDEVAVLITAMQRRYLPCVYKVLGISL